MEGGGESMVGVFRWLSDAGLSFSFLSSFQQRQRADGQTAPPPARNPSKAVASQTLSEHKYKRRHSVKAQYASTYQTSHCGVNACSPDGLHKEFPPQRRNPSPAYGNFKVGNISDIHGYSTDTDPPSSVSAGKFHGSKLRPQHERFVEAFVNSLRKYPSVTARSIPTEVIEQLLKTSPKQSKTVPPKKHRHLWDKPRPLASLSPYATRHKESCKRPRRKKQVNAQKDLKDEDCGPSSQLISITTFDYLNSGGSVSPRVEVKRIETKPIKNTVKDMYSKRKAMTVFPLCPTLNKRYERHVKKYHPTTSKNVEYPNLETCSRCLLKRPCPCETAKFFHHRLDKGEQEKMQIEDTIFSWLKDIPVYPDEKPRDKMIRDAIVKKLAETLSGLDNGKFYIEGKEEIKQAIAKMPMWYPKREEERQSFKNSITDNLLERIKHIKELKKFNQTTQDFFDGIKFVGQINTQKALDDMITELDKIAIHRPESNDIYRDLLKIKAFELLDRFPIKSNGNKYEYLNKLSDEIADRLLKVSTKTIDPEYKRDIGEAIRNMLDDSNVRIKNREIVEEKLRDLLADVVTQNVDKDEAESYIKSMLDGKNSDSDVENITDKLLALADVNRKIIQTDPAKMKIIIEDIREILDLSDARMKDKDKVEEILRKLVSDIATKGLDEDNAKSQIKYLLEGKVSEDQLKNISNRVLELADQLKQAEIKTIVQHTKETMCKDIRDILETFDVHIRDKEDITDQLSKLVTEIITKDVDRKNIESQINQIKYILKGKVSEHKLEDIAQEMLTLADSVKQDNKIKQIIKEDVHDILDQPNVQINNREKVEEGLSKVIADVTTKGIDEDKAKRQVISILKGKVSANTLEDITEQVLTLADRIKPLDNETKQIIKEDVQGILDQPKLKINNREKVEEGLSELVADITTKGIDDDKAKNKVESILKGKVSETTLEDITEQVLALADRIKPLDNETKQIIKEDVHGILDQPNVKINNREKVKEGLSKLIADITTKGLDDDETKSKVESLLKGKVSESTLEDIIEQVVTLADRMKPLDNETKQIIKEDVHDILDLPNVQFDNRKKVEEGLSKLIADINTKGIDDDKAKRKVKFILQGKVSEPTLEDITEQVLALADRIKPLDNETKQIIKEDVHEILDLPNVQFDNRKKVEEGLIKLIADITTKGLDDDETKSKVESILKGKVSETTLEDITEQVLTLADRIKPLDNETRQIIKEDVHDILDLPNVQINNRKKVEEGLSKLIADINTKGIDDDKAKNKVESILKGKVSETTLEDITEQLLALADRIKPLDNETRQIIKEDVHDILDLPNVQINNRKKVEEGLSKLIADINTKGIDDDKAKNKVESILEGKVSEITLEDITEQLLALADRIKPLDNETRQIIKEDVHDILDLPNVQINNRKKVEEGLSKLIADINTKGIDDDKAKNKVESILEGKVSEITLENITEQLLALADRIKPLDNETKQIIKEDVHGILDLPNVQLNNRKKVEEGLSKLIADINTKGINEDKAKRKVESILEGKVSETTLEDITKQVLALTSRITPIDQGTKQIIKKDVRDILNFSDAEIKKIEKVVEFLSKSVAEIAIKDMDNKKAAAQIKAILKSNVPINKLEDITKQILTLAKQLKSIQVKSIDPETKKNTEKYISDILTLSEPDIKDKRKIQEKLCNIVYEVLSKKLEKDNAKTAIKSILKGKVPDNNVEDVTIEVLELANNLEVNQTMHYQKPQETLTEDISDILDHTHVHIKNRGDVEESLRDILSDLIMRGMDKSKAHDYIYSTLKGNIPDSHIEDISRRILALAEHPSPSFNEYNGGPVAHSTQNEEKILFDQVYEVIRDWLKIREIHLSNRKIKEVAEAIANETLDRRKYLQLNPEIEISETMESEILKEQIYKVLNKLVDKNLVQLIMTDIQDLMRYLKQIPSLEVSRDSSKGIAQDSIQFVQENLEGALLDWVRRSSIYQNQDIKNKNSQEQIFIKLAESLAAVLGSREIQKPGTDPDNILLNEISKHIKNLPLDPKLKSEEYIQKLSSNLLEYLKNLQLFQNISTRVSQKTNTSFLSSTNHLNDTVKDWCEALQISDNEEASAIKQDLANKILLKIGEMNMNPDILNDDLLYDEILQDFIDQQAEGLQISKHVTSADKKVLLDQIKQIKQKVQDDFIGKKYKQQLRDTISKSLPMVAGPTIEDLASFELMKENLADAFINLNYSVDDETAKAKYRRKIIEEVNKYVNNYLRRSPATPVSTRQLNENLHKALKNVPLPDDESMRTEVESVRMKGVINDWLKTLPMGKQSPSEQLHTNKIVTLMAQILQELENEFHPDFEKIAMAEIALYLKKLPLKNKNNLHEMAKKLIEKIKNTAESRAFVEGSRSKLSDDCLCEDFPLSCAQVNTRIPYCATFIPPCGLSKNDQAIMQRIRERSRLCEAATQSRRCKDAAVNPPPLDHGSQTEMPCHIKCCQRAEEPEHMCSKPATLKNQRTPINTRPCPLQSKADLSPYVQVRKYNLAPPKENKVQSSTQTPVGESGRMCIPSSPVHSERICYPRPCITPTPRRYIKPRSRLEYPTCRRPTPRRQCTSACPTEYFSRPKHCLRSPLLPERDYLRSSCRRIEPSCGRPKSPCLSCQANPTTSRNKCLPMHVCPHPTCLYFK